MKILLTNDDGIFAPGLAAMYKELVKMGDVTVVAPAAGQSGASHKITFYEPLIFNHINIEGMFQGYSVQGTPADCVKLAVMQISKEPFDLLVAGINDGANAGINVFYSGTVAAAMEGAFLSIPAIATSLARDEHMDFDTAAKYCVHVIKKLMPIKSGNVININIPHLHNAKPKGIRVVPQSTEGFDEYYVPKVNETGQTEYKLHGGTHRSEEELTDTISIADGYITVTALIPDMTDHAKTKELSHIVW